MIAARQIAFGKAAGGKLPDGVIPVEYIESTGTQWIDTGINSIDATAFDIKLMPSASGPRYQFYIGSWSNSDFTLAQIATDVTSCYLRYAYDQTINATSLVSASAVNNILINDDRQFVVNGTVVGSVKTEKLGTVSDSIFIAGSVLDARCFIGRIYSCKIYADTLVRSLIPVLDSADTPCMYDEVSGEFFYNAGTGEFIAGPEITEE